MTEENKPLFEMIERGELDVDLFELKQAIELRLNVTRSSRHGVVVPGDKVTFKQDIRPRKLAGRTATVVHTNGKGRNKIVVDLDQPVDRWSKGISCQLAHLDLAA
jgi:hypothetical protein